jgi:DNA-binding transcriptional LysR family regulator
LNVNWDDLRIFLAIARAERISAAAKRLGLDHSTVSRRVAALEESLGARVIERSPSGIKLTPHGNELLTYAERIEAELLTATHNLGGREAQLSGTVRLATPEAFGTWLVAANARAFHKKHPAINLELIPQSRSINLSKHEADIVVSLQRPPRGRVFCKKLADFTLGLYSSKDYLARREAPAALNDLKDHDVVWFIDDLLMFPELRFLDHVTSGGRVAFRSSSIIAQQHAIAGGSGIGLLYHFTAAQDPRFVPVLPKVEVSRPYWIIVHANFRQTPRVRAVVAFLEELAALGRKASPNGSAKRAR